MSEATGSAKPLASDAQRARARAVLFWIGVVYICLLVFSMTPLTHQLDDIKETVIYAIGPIGLIVYLAFLAMGWVDPPRRGILIPLAAYYAVVFASAIAAQDFVQWKAWQGVWKQWVLLGPFFAFLGCCGDPKWLRRSLVFFTLVTFGANLFGLAHFGVAAPLPGEPHRRVGIFHLLSNHYREKLYGDLGEMREQHRQMVENWQRETDAARKRQLYETVVRTEQFLQMKEREMQQRRERSPAAMFLFNLAVTFDGPDARKTMMSVILNRAFYAGYLLLMIPLALAAFVALRSWSWRWLPLLTILLSWFSIMATRSKVSPPAAAIQAALIFVLVLVGARLRIRHRRRWVMFAFTLAVILVCFGMFFSFGDDVLELFAEGGWERFERKMAISFRSRLIIWQGGLEIWKANPILGGGPLNFDILFPFYRRPDYNLNEISHRTIFAHNFFLDLLGETGSLGFLTFMAFLGFLAWRCMVRMRRDAEDRHSILAICLVGALAGFFMNNFVSPNGRWPICAGNLWAVLGIVAGFVNRPLGVAVQDRWIRWWGPSPRQKTLAWVLAVAAFGCWLHTAPYGVNYFRSAIHNNNGLALLGPDGAEGPVQILLREMQRQRAELGRPNLPPAQRQELEARFERTASRYRQLRSEALEEFRKCVDINPHFTSAYYKIANLLFYGADGKMEPEDVEAALEVYHKLQEYQPEYAQIRQNLSSVYWNLGRAKLSGGRRDEGIRDIKTALMQGRRSSEQSIMWPANYTYIVRLTSARTLGAADAFGGPDMWRPEDFLTRLQRREHPAAQHVWKSLESRTQEAVADWKKGDEPTAALLDRLAADLDKLLKEEEAWPKDLVDAIDMPESARQRIEAGETPAFERNWIVLGDAFSGVAAMQYEEEAIRRARRMFEWWGDTLGRKSTIGMMPKDQEQVWADVVDLYVRTAQETGRDGDLARALEASHKLDPDNERVIRGMVSTYVKIGAFNELERVLKGILKDSPQRTAERSFLAQLYLQMGRLREAKEQVLILQRIGPQLPDGDFLRFAVAKAAGQDEEAAQWGKKYLKNGKNPKWRKMVEETIP